MIGTRLLGRGRARAEEKVLGSGSLVLGKADKAGASFLGTRLLGRARAEEKERKKWSCGPVVLWKS
ncbi:hypothetical protein BOO33_18410 [Vibrio navarrensis]|nr:hypothetical protein [Vibrio navarrensis]